MSGAPDPIVKSVPTEGGDPVFNEPWQARIFAVVSRLAMDGQFPWDDFKEKLIGEIGAVDAEDATNYYVHFLNACEELLTANGILDVDDLSALVDDLKAHPPHPNSSAPGPIAIDAAR